MAANRALRTALGRQFGDIPLLVPPPAWCTDNAAMIAAAGCLGLRSGRRLALTADAVSRLPFLAGIDRYLPESFGRTHPRWGTPHVAFLWQAVFATAFLLLSQAGATVAGT